MNTLKLNKTILFLVATTFLAAGCSNGSFQLPDDPNDESSFASEGSGSEGSSAVTDPGTETPAEVPAVEEPPQLVESAEDAVLAKYAHLDPKHLINTTHLKAAVLYYDANKAKIKRPEYMTVIDYSLKSTKARFFIVTMSTGAVQALHVAHGKGSDSNHDGYAEKFSNVEGSNATSLGFFFTAETYNGSNGYSLRLDGLSSTNSRARERAIVIHGASYVQEKEVIQGRSWGCPALESSLSKGIINQIKGGTLVYSAYK
jgi:hypothetical protein